MKGPDRIFLWVAPIIAVVVVFAGYNKYIGAYCIDDSALYSLQHFHYLNSVSDSAFMAPRLRGRAIVVSWSLYGTQTEDSLFLGKLGYEKVAPKVWRARE